MKTTGITQLMTVLALLIAPVGMFLTYNGIDDLRVVTVTAFSVAWLSMWMLAYYRKSTLQRVRAWKQFPTVPIHK
ncbi:MAG: hypothetical protein OXL97_11175 [Chloroflexota bacterium]|nr:hypothetical protein [Chloroflexota bacterium]MDE2884939.1 hypothetical protein [Chloroflexota bacterium]